jgi:hypothetical protein
MDQEVGPPIFGVDCVRGTAKNEFYSAFASRLHGLFNLFAHRLLDARAKIGLARFI